MVLFVHQNNQSLLLEQVYDEVKKELAERGAYILKVKKLDKVRSIIIK